MNQIARVVNVFSTPYEAWSYRQSPDEEALSLCQKGYSLAESFTTKDKLLEEVSNNVQAAARMLREGADNALERHIDKALSASSEYRDLRNLMPSNVPQALSAYQAEFSEADLSAADSAIKAIGVTMPNGQFLFHGGSWPLGVQTFTTTRPFSTSFCPQVARRNAEWKSKAYDAGRMDLMVVHVIQPQTKAYAYSRDGDLGNEKEVVFATGAQLTLTRETHIADVTASKVGPHSETLKRTVPAYLLEIDIS